MQPKNHNYIGLSKRTILGKNYSPNVHFVRPSVDDIRTTPSVRIYPTDAQLLADRFLNFLRIHAGKNPFARTLPVRTDTARPCGHTQVSAWTSCIPADINQPSARTPKHPHGHRSSMRTHSSVRADTSGPQTQLVLPSLPPSLPPSLRPSLPGLLPSLLRSLPPSFPCSLPSVRTQSLVCMDKLRPNGHSKKKKKKLGKERKNNSVFDFQSPRSLRSPRSPSS
jgi:hypothetical protein